ncbi:IclR family transcriptional regulator [Loktanella sp. DJP18]|uniref:IclR family transcriptional regulator n=1 Tax=Loktanella sp. DJP18 TaxID=3409788 RepID=UPI003BB5E883
MAGGADGTVGKALDVLDRVAGFGRPVRFSEVLALSAFPKPTLYRLLQTLVSQGMLSYDDDRQTYAPGARLVRLAHAAWAQSSLAQVASVHLMSLSATTHETVHLAQLDHGQVLYLDKRNAASPVEMYSQAGKVGPAYCTGVGKAMLAFVDPDQADAIIAQQSFHRFQPGTLTTPAALRRELQATRARGYAFDREEHEPGIICIAAPVLMASGRVLGAVSVTSTTTRMDLTGLEALAPQVRDTAAAIAQDAAKWSFPDTGMLKKMKLAGE